MSHLPGRGNGVQHKILSTRYASDCAALQCFVTRPYYAPAARANQFVAVWRAFFRLARDLARLLQSAPESDCIVQFLNSVRILDLRRVCDCRSDATANRVTCGYQTDIVC
jgi:hypothetical protein